MSRPLIESRGRLPRYTLRNLGLIVTAYVLYGALLFGTSAILANPGHAQLDGLPDSFADGLIDVARPTWESWTTASTPLGTPAH